MNIRKISQSLFIIICALSFAYAQGNWEDSGANPETWTTGNVGIGTSTPSNLLDVQGGLATFGDAVNHAEFNDEGELRFRGDARYVVIANTHAFKAGGSDIGLYFNAANNRLEFQDAAGTRMFSTDIAGGNAGTGYFDNDLTVNNDLFITGNLVVEANTYAFRTIASDIGVYFNQVDERIEFHDVAGNRTFSAGIGGAEWGSGWFRGDIEAGGTVTADFFVGDGSQLTNIPAASNIWQESGSNIYYNAGDVTIGAASGLARLAVNTAAAGPDILRLQVDGSTEVVVNESGHMGIGTVNPVARLSLQEQNNEDVFRAWANNAVRARIDGTGKVGLGTDLDPISYQLSVRDQNHQIAIIDEDNSDKHWTITSVQDISGYGIFEESENGHFVIAAGGNVGIGTLKPDYQTHIVGGGDALTVDNDLVDVSNLNTVFQRSSNTLTDAVGIGFSHSTNQANIGAAIIHQQTALESSGSLHFATKRSGVAADDLPIVMTLDSQGELGLGTMNPTDEIHIVDEEFSRIQMQATDPVDDVQMFIDARGDGADAGQLGTLSNHDVIFYTNNFSRMWLTESGDLGIGTNVPQSKLAVAGKITAQEVEVTLAGWPDYVFSEDYDLMPLDEVEAHIEEHKHLPGVPSEADVLENGVALGEMQAVMLEKIEELTLHLIDLKKQVDDLKAENQTLRTENSSGGVE